MSVKPNADIDALQDSIVGAYDLCHVSASEVLDVIKELRDWRAQGVAAEEPEWEYEVTYSSASAPTIDGHRLRRSSGMLPSLAAVAEWMNFALNPITHRRTKAIPAGEWERLPTEQEGPDDV